jgi:hypothetical protein
MTDVFPCWCRRHHKTVRVLETPAEVVSARLDELRMRRHDDGPTPVVEVKLDSDLCPREMANASTPGGR